LGPRWGREERKKKKRFFTLLPFSESMTRRKNERRIRIGS